MSSVNNAALSGSKAAKETKNSPALEVVEAKDRLPELLRPRLQLPRLDKLVAFPKVSVVIPTLNEAKNLPLLLPQMPDWIDELIIVDGHSKDDTVAVAKQLYPAVHIVNATRRGKGAALAAGFRAASGDIIVTLDADGSMSPFEMFRYVGALMSGGDFAKGSRFIQGGGTKDMSLIRMLGNWGLMHICRALCGGEFSDLCYGYNAFWRRHLPLLDIDCDGFEIETALSLSALKSGLEIVEVPSFESPRIYGVSNLRAVSDGIRVLRMILRQAFSRAAPAGSCDHAPRAN